MCCSSKNLRICLVDIIEDVWLAIELVCHLQGPVYVADAALVVAVHVDGHLRRIHRGGHAAQVVKRVHVLGLIFWHFKHIHHLAESCLGCHDRCFWDEEGPGFEIIGRQILSVEPFLIVGHFPSILIAPWEVWGIYGRDTRLQMVVNRIFDGCIQCLHLQRGRCRLHGHDVVPLLILRNGIIDDGVQCDIVTTETLVAPFVFGSHLGGDDAYLWGVRTDDYVGDVFWIQRILDGVVNQRMSTNNTDVLVRYALRASPCRNNC